MSLASVTSGGSGLILAYVLTAIPLGVAMVRRQTRVVGLMAVPFWAIPATLVGLLISNLLAFLLHTPSGTQTAMAFLLGAAACCFSGYLAGVLVIRPPRRHGDEHARGTVVRSSAAMPPARQGALTLAGVEIPPLDEPKHFKMIGTTGSGKSTAIRELLSGALARGDRAIIADPDGGYLARFFSA